MSISADLTNLIAFSAWFIYDYSHPVHNVTEVSSYEPNGAVKAAVLLDYDATKGQSVLALLIATAVTNFLTSILITTRLLHGHRLLKVFNNSEDRRDSPYLSVITICVESSALITVIAVANIVSFLASLSLRSSSYTLALLPQLCVSLITTQYSNDAL